MAIGLELDGAGAKNELATLRVRPTGGRTAKPAMPPLQPSSCVPNHWASRFEPDPVAALEHAAARARGDLQSLQVVPELPSGAARQNL
jgi:hypothetical protein